MSVLSLRYAHALAGAVSSLHLDSHAAEQQLRDFAGTFAGSRELREVLMDPSIPSPQKLKVLDAIAARIGMYKQVRNFVAVITDHQRLYELESILAEYILIVESEQGLAEAEIISIRRLGEEERAELEAEVAKLTGSRAKVTYREDPALLGGVVVRIGSMVYDGSVRAQLDRLKQSLMTAQA